MGLGVWNGPGWPETGGDENRIPTVSETKIPGMEKDGPMPILITTYFTCFSGINIIFFCFPDDISHVFHLCCYLSYGFHLFRSYFLWVLTNSRKAAANTCELITDIRVL